MNNFVDRLEVNQDDFVLLTGNMMRFLKKAKTINRSYTLDTLIDQVLNKVGKQGTLAIQTFNWDFCHGKAYDIINSKAQTGVLGNTALKRNDFKRTTHPIYSFAVSGCHQKTLTDLNNKGAFDKTSPFNAMHNLGAKMIVVDLPLQNSFTFVHYVEEAYGVHYRHNKSFQGDYTGKDGQTTKRSYDMFVRNIEENIRTSIQPLEKIFTSNNVMKTLTYNTINIRIIDLKTAYSIIADDIINNNAQSLYTINSPASEKA